MKSMTFIESTKELPAGEVQSVMGKCVMKCDCCKGRKLPRCAESLILLQYVAIHFGFNYMCIAMTIVSPQASGAQLHK